MKVNIKNIRWYIEDENGDQPEDYEKTREELGLPEEDTVDFDDDEAARDCLDELVSDYLSEVYCFLTEHFEYEVVE